MNDFKKDYYRILEIKTSATTDEIKIAYRKQVKKYHPDLYPGKREYEDLIRDINEAYEVLRNKDERFAYDQYLLNKKYQQESERKSSEAKNKRTYTKTTTVDTEERTYLKGKIFIKYFGEHDERDAENVLREIYYKIKVTATKVIVDNIYKQHLTKEFHDVFALNKPIGLNIKQPISCKLVNQDGNVVNYKLEILDLTIPNPEIIDVTKHEGESFGTITGTFYGYVKKTKSDEVNETVEECYGETGKTERKNENGKNYLRKEYYNSDCTKYWGNWTLEVSKNTYQTSGSKKSGNYRNSYGSNNDGCFGSFGGIFSGLLGILFIFFLVPQLAFLFPLFLLLFLFNLIPSKSWHWLTKIVSTLFGLIFLASIIAAISSRKFSENEKVVTPQKPRVKRPTYTPLVDSLSNSEVIDTLISHHVSWSDYSGKTYEGSFSVKRSAVVSAHCYKENLDIPLSTENAYDNIVFSLKENDKGQLGGLYSMLDSLKQKNKPNQMEFAEIIVSLVQSIPYTLVLPESCDSQVYHDEYTTKYLAQADARCDGFQKYGINTPVEFLAYLNGDCDTRTLLLYSILSHYQYDVALLSSEYYSHSILGINLPYEGIAYTYDNQRYIFWETTVPRIKPGILSNEISNIQHWRISLKSK